MRQFGNDNKEVLLVKGEDVMYEISVTTDTYSSVPSVIMIIVILLVLVILTVFYLYLSVQTGRRQRRRIRQNGDESKSPDY